VREHGGDLTEFLSRSWLADYPAYVSAIELCEFMDFLGTLYVQKHVSAEDLDQLLGTTILQLHTIYVGHMTKLRKDFPTAYQNFSRLAKAVSDLRETRP